MRIEHFLIPFEISFAILALAELRGDLKSLSQSLVVKSVSFERLRALNHSLVVNSVSKEGFNLSFLVAFASAVRVCVAGRASLCGYPSKLDTSIWRLTTP